LKKWTEDEVKVLIERYPTAQTSVLARLLERSIASLYGKARALGLKKDENFLRMTREASLSLGRTEKRAHPKWSEDEIKILKEMYPTRPKDEILRKIKGRTWRAIYSKASKLHVSRELTSDELYYYDKLRLRKEVRLKQLSEAEKGYIAGLIDGEGSFIVWKDKYHNHVGYRLTITNTDPKLHEWLRKRLGFGAIRKLEQKNRKHRTGYYFAICRSSELELLLREIKDFLVVKREHAECMLRLIEIKKSKKVALERGPHGRFVGGYRRLETSEEEWALYQKIRQLNNSK